MRKTVTLSFLYLFISIISFGQCGSSRNVLPSGVQWPDFIRQSQLFNNANTIRSVQDEKGFPAKTALSSWKFDTIITYETNGSIARLVRTFDNRGNILVFLNQVWQNNNWVNTTRETSAYNSQNLALSYLREAWINEVWAGITRYYYTYDARGNELTSLVENWEDSTWINYSRETYTYDTAGFLTEHLTEVWSQQGTWSGCCREEYSYSDDGTTGVYLRQMFMDDAWLNTDSVTWIQDASGHLLEYVMSQWHVSQWDFFIKYTCTYDAGGNMLTFVMEQWLGASWMNEYRKTYTYDQNSNNISLLLETWQNGWLNDWKDTMTYNPDGFMLEMINLDWQGGTWVNYFRRSIEYDPGNSLHTQMESSWRSGMWADSLLLMYGYDTYGNSVAGRCQLNQLGNWNPVDGNLTVYSRDGVNIYEYSLSGIYRYTAHFAGFVNGMKDIRQADHPLLVYPDPARETITVYYSRFRKGTEGLVSVYDLNGQPLLRRILKTERTELPVGSLPHGTYLLELRSGTAREITRFVRE